MGYVVEGWEVRLRDTETGRVLTREVKPGAAWPCPDEAATPRTGGAEAPRRARREARASEGKRAKTRAEAPPAKVAAPTSTRPEKEARDAEAAPAAADRAPKKEARSKTRRDMSDPKVRERFDKEVLRAVKAGARTVRAIGKRFKAASEAELVPIVASLGRLVEAGKVAQTGTGPGATFRVPAGDKPQAARPEPPPSPPAPEIVPRAPVELSWVAEVIEGYQIYRAEFEGGAFQLTRRMNGQFQLTHEKPGQPLYKYGCGDLEPMKALARQLAMAGVPSPEVWVKSGKSIDACARHTRIDGIDLEWREIVDQGHELCVAATADGEFRMKRNASGSFALLFIARGDQHPDDLGCGPREALEARAIEVLGQVAAPVIEEAPPRSTTPTPTAPAPDAAEEPASEASEPVDEAKDNAILQGLADVLAQVKGTR